MGKFTYQNVTTRPTGQQYILEQVPYRQYLGNNRPGGENAASGSVPRWRLYCVPVEVGGGQPVDVAEVGGGTVEAMMGGDSVVLGRGQVAAVYQVGRRGGGSGAELALSRWRQRRRGGGRGSRNGHNKAVEAVVTRQPRRGGR
ncbi:hypothetical protein EDB84DRAFT_1446186 [Lactarius hengduanensis]|nr:hypothetical protein EDB84DRAFT_1446186 [Lactarius hengduanensis]